MFPLPVLWLIACFVLQLALANRGNPATELASAAWVGSMWAGWAGCLWASSAMGNRWLQLTFIAMVGAWHIGWMTVIREQPAVRYLLMLGAYAVVQSILFRLLRVPNWSFATFRLVPIDNQRRQFSILELLLRTTMVALLITASKRYEPSGGQAFWSGSPIVCLSLAGIAPLCTLAIVSPHRSSRLTFAIASVASVAVGSAVMAWLETIFDPNETMRFGWAAYFCICGVFDMLFIVLAACGRLGRVNFPERPSHGFKTTAQPNSGGDESPPSNDLLPFRQPPRM